MQMESTYVPELYGITEEIIKWRQNLMGQRFIIHTDHYSLKNLINRVIQTPEQHQYLNELLSFSYLILYKRAKEHDNQNFNKLTLPFPMMVRSINCSSSSSHSLISLTVLSWRMNLMRKYTYFIKGELGLPPQYTSRNGLLFEKGD